jgi:hypothetical protein
MPNACVCDIHISFADDFECLCLIPPSPAHPRWGPADVTLLTWTRLGSVSLASQAEKDVGCLVEK